MPRKRAVVFNGRTIFIRAKLYFYEKLKVNLLLTFQRLNIADNNNLPQSADFSEALTFLIILNVHKTKKKLLCKSISACLQHSWHLSEIIFGPNTLKDGLKIVQCALSCELNIRPTQFCAEFCGVRKSKQIHFKLTSDFRRAVYSKQQF